MGKDAERGIYMKTLVTYFSAEGTTAKVAKELAEKIEADIFEIVPAEPYSKQIYDGLIRWPDAIVNN